MLSAGRREGQDHRAQGISWNPHAKRSGYFRRTPPGVSLSRALMSVCRFELPSLPPTSELNNFYQKGFLSPVALDARDAFGNTTAAGSLSLLHMQGGLSCREAAWAPPAAAGEVAPGIPLLLSSEAPCPRPFPLQ